MKKAYLVMRQELITTFSRPAYLFFAFGFPVLAVLILGGVRLIQGGSQSDTGMDPTGLPTHQLEREGFVDHAGLILTIADDLQDYLLPYESESQAKEALAVDEITAYYIIPEDYIASGEVYYVYPNDKPYLSDGQKWIIQSTLILNLLAGDSDLADLIWNPIWELKTRNITPQVEGAAVSGEDCSRPGAACQSNELIRMIPSLLVVIFFITFMSSSSMLFNAIGAEKENRTIELLLLSISPRQLLTGKTLALGLAGLLQTLTWLTTIYISFNMGGSTLSLPAGFHFPVEIVAWSLVFFIGGFALYASLMAGAGALVPKMKEAGIANFIAMAPLFLGYIFGILAPLAEATGSFFLVFLSIFPFTSPVVMVMRLTDGVVLTWQLLLSVALLFITAYFVLKMVAAMFHAQNLLSGQPFSIYRYLKTLAGRA
jgi:ABC-2 type transport system permease protein